MALGGAAGTEGAPGQTEGSGGAESISIQDLEGMSLTKLRALAKDLGITGYSGMDKDTVIAAIKEVWTDGGAGEDPDNG